MARNNKEKNKKKPFFLKKWFIGIAAALGISAVGLGTYETVIKDEDKQLEKVIDDLDESRDIVDNSREKQTIEDEIKNTLNKGITFAEDKIEESLALEGKKELVKETIDIGKELLPTESLDFSKDENKTITSYSDKYNYDNLIIPIIKDFKTNSIIDALNEVGYDSSLTSRARLAVYFNIISSEGEFKGLAIQNTTLLECLIEYARNLQNSAHDDYAKVLDDTTLKNSAPDNNSPSYGDNTSDNGNDNNNSGEKDRDKDNDKKKPQKHKHDWSDWEAVDDEKEKRECPTCGKTEEQDHPSYGEWIDNGDDTKSRTCDNCGHIETKPYIWREWLSIDDDYEHRFREDGKEEKQLHPFGEFIDNGDGTETKTCPNCGHKVTKKKEEEHNHNWSDWEAVDDEKEKRECPTCGKTEEQDHPYGDWVDFGNNQESKTCPNCGNVVIRDKHQHKPEEQAPVSLNATDEENCAVIYYKCLDDDYIDESLTEYVPHNLPDTPEDVLGDEGLFKCGTCGMEIIKKITGIEEDSEEDYDLPIDFDPSSFNNEEYEFIDEEEISLEQVEVINNEEEQEENLDDDNILLLEDKSAKPLIEDQQKDLETVLNTFDTELYKSLFKKKQILEQFASKGIKSDETLDLLRYIDVIKSNMVQELANALVKEDLKKLEQGEQLTFKI